MRIPNTENIPKLKDTTVHIFHTYQSTQTQLAPSGFN